MRVPLVILFAIVTLNKLHAEERSSFTAPTSERIAALLEFSGPITLNRKIATPKELKSEKNQKNRNGAALDWFSYSNLEISHDVIKIGIYKKGEFLGKKRANFEESVARQGNLTSGDDFPKLGTFTAADGRTIYQFLGGIGPGGSAYAALLSCKDARYEIVIIHEKGVDENDKDDVDDVSPKKDVKSVIEAIESIVFQ